MTTLILCPVDGTDHAAVGLAMAVELALLMQAHLTICAINLATGGARGPTQNLWSDAAAAALLTKVEGEARALGATRLNLILLTARSPGAAIVAFAAAIEASHVVMGCGSGTDGKRGMLGSVAAEVAGQARCSVTIAR